MARIKDQLGQAIHGGEAAFLDLTAAKEDSKRLEERLSAKEADVAALQQEQGDSQPRPIVISYVVLRHAFAGGAGRLREELSSSCGVVERANRSAEELRTTLEEERRKIGQRPTAEVPHSAPKYNPVLRSTPQYSGVPRSTPKYRAILRGNPKYPEVLRSTPKYPTILRSTPQ